ncbi:MAG: peptidylprolyl isomerase [Acidobacteriota bacterium]|nr:peptidylprolyl isomerase [Acidobacteriota bacterium]
MSKTLLIPLIFLALLFSLACADDRAGRKPVADNEIAVIEMEQPAYGVIKLELYSNIAPEMVAQFKQLARAGVYNGTTFHRVNPTLIQGGDPLSKDADPTNDGTGNSEKPDVPAEFSDVPYEAGTVGAARTQDPDSANAQFFITLKRVPQFDNKYTVFGKVIEGLNNARTISGVNPKQGERPIENVTIKSITIEPK